MVNPLISVVMSVYNGEEYLHLAIDSILNQSLKDFEFIIVNDGSTDKSLEIIKGVSDDRIVLIDQPNTGLSKALNNGIEKAKAKYIARMDADDISLPNRLQLQFDFLEQNDDVVVVGGCANIIDKDGHFIYSKTPPLTWEEIKRNLPRTPFFHPSVMFRRKQFIEVGKYNVVPIEEDAIFFIKMSKIGKMVNLSIPLINYRITPGSISRKSKRTAQLAAQYVCNFYQTGKIDPAESVTLEQSIKRDSKAMKDYHYQILLSKKYLWSNNPNTRLARTNSLQAIKVCPLKMEPFILFFLSFFPSVIVASLYKNLKPKK